MDGEKQIMGSSMRDGFCTYRVCIRDLVEEADLSSIAPPGLVLEQDDKGETRLSFRSDQSGLVGLIRQLHGLGFVILSVRRA